MKHGISQVRAAAEQHNANALYRAAGYPPLVTHVATLDFNDGRDVVFFNVAVGEDPLARLRAINHRARLYGTKIVEALVDSAIA
jgi:hypothetical protein